MSEQGEIFKTQVTVEFPKELEGNMLLITYDPEQVTGVDEGLMKAEIGEAIAKVLQYYPSAVMKAYKFKK